MPVIDVNLEGDNAWPDIVDAPVIHVPDAEWKIALLRGGMTSGRSSLALRIDLPDGQVLVAETSVAAMAAAWAAIAAACEHELS